MKIVVAHHPFYSGGEHGDTPYIIDTSFRCCKNKVQPTSTATTRPQHLQAGAVTCSAPGRFQIRPTNTRRTQNCQRVLRLHAIALQADKMDVG